MAHILIDEINKLETNKEKIARFIGAGLNPRYGLSAEFTHLMFLLYQEASGDISMAGRFNCGACHDIIFRKLNDFLAYNDNSGKPLLNWEKKDDTKPKKKVKKELTIIIPVYSDMYLQETLASIKVPDDTKVEILIGIDGNKQTKENLLKTTLPPNTRLFYSYKNTGPYIVRNTLLTHAKYENILFFDADDIMSDNLIEDTINKLQDNDVVRWQCYDFKETTEVYKLGIWSIGVFGIKRDLFIKMNGFYNWFIGADSEFAYRSTPLTTELSDDSFFYRRDHLESLTNSPETGFKTPMRNKIIHKIQTQLREKDFPNPEDFVINKNMKEI